MKKKKKKIILTVICLLAVCVLCVLLILYYQATSETTYILISEYEEEPATETKDPFTVHEAVIAACKDMSAEYGHTNAFDELKVYRETVTRDGNHTYRLRQNYKGIPVYQSYVCVITDSEGKIICLFDYTYDIPDDISLTPTVTLERMNEIATQYECEFNQLPNQYLVIQNYSDEIELGYLLQFNGYDVLIDAMTGQILSYHSILDW